MKATRQLHDAGQSLWLDNITRSLLTGGTLSRYIGELSVTGLTSNPTIFDHAIKNSHDYDAAIREKTAMGLSGEELFFELALEDLTRAADLFRQIHSATNGVDGWVSLEVSPTLAYDTSSTVAAARDLHARAGRPNLFIKIPGTAEGIPAIEEAIFAGVPVNVTLLFSREHYVAAAEAYIRGIERRVAAGLNPHVGSVASVFVSRWDSAVADKVPAELKGRLGIAIAQRTYKAYRDLLGEPKEEAEGVLGHAVLRVVEVQAHAFDRETLTATRIVGEELAEVDVPDLRVMVAESLPGGAVGERNGRHVISSPAQPAFLRVWLLSTRHASSSVHEVTKAAAPSRWSSAASTFTSTPVWAKRSRTSSASPPSCGSMAPISPWSASASRVFSGMVFTECGAASDFT